MLSYIMLTRSTSDFSPVATAPRFASRIDRLQGSALRNIFSVIKNPDVISFAGGLPAASQFPALDFSAVGHADLQYGASEGQLELRKLIAQRLCDSGLPVVSDQILILSGSQQGIDLVAKLFVEEGSKVGIESPTYLATMQVMTLLGADYCPFAPGRLDQLARHDDIRLLYLNPTFQNPTGRIYTSEQREAFARHCRLESIVLFEDDPYRDIVFEDCDRRPICGRLAEDPSEPSWIYQSTFSKSLAPGLRLGFLACSEELYEPLLYLKQAADLHTSGISQSLVTNKLRDENYAVQLQNTVATYRALRDHFDRILQQTLAPFFRWSVPSGGLFFWLTLKDSVHLDLNEFFHTAITAGVAFMPGEYFRVSESSSERAASHDYDDIESSRSIRLNFSCVNELDATRGLEVLGQVARDLSHGSAGG